MAPLNILIWRDYVYNHAMKWVWQQDDWPNFSYSPERFIGRDNEFRLLSERLSGRVEAQSEECQRDAIIDLMLSEAITTSAIEGETLDRNSVRSSLLALITEESIPENTDQKSAGAASLLISTRKNWSNPLSQQLLGEWQSKAIPEQRTNNILRGQYRNDMTPMQVISGYYGRHKVHYEAPPSSQVYDEMERFIDWYNQTNPLNGQCNIPSLVRVGVAHLWFEKIHPYDDGNGRVGRAIADHALSQHLGYPTLACLATAINSDRKRYYFKLDNACRNDLYINHWLDYFTDTTLKAQDIAEEEVAFVLGKTRFYDTYADQLNDRQSKIVARVFAEGRKGFEGGISTKKYETITGCPNRTASRDLADLLEMGAIQLIEGQGGRSTRYELSIPASRRFGLKL